MPPAACAPGLPMTQIPRSAAAETEQPEFDIERNNNTRQIAADVSQSAARNRQCDRPGLENVTSAHTAGTSRSGASATAS